MKYLTRIKWRIQYRGIELLVGGRGVLMNLSLDTRTKIVLDAKPEGYLVARCHITGLLPSGRKSRSKKPCVSIGAAKTASPSWVSWAGADADL